MAFVIVLGATFTALGDVTGISQKSAASLRNSWREAERVVDSSVIPLSASVVSTDVDVVIANRGRVKYAGPGFKEWEVVVRYEDAGGAAYVEYLSYADTLVTGSWTVQQIYLDYGASVVEIYEPDILNPAEEMVIRARLANVPGGATLNIVTVSPPEGGAGTVHFDG